MTDERKTIFHEGKMYWEKVIHVPMTGERQIGENMEHRFFIDSMGFLRAEARLAQDVLVPKIPRDQLVEI